MRGRRDGILRAAGGRLDFARLGRSACSRADRGAAGPEGTAPCAAWVWHVGAPICIQRFLSLYSAPGINADALGAGTQFESHWVFRSRGIVGDGSRLGGDRCYETGRGEPRDASGPHQEPSTDPTTAFSPALPGAVRPGGATPIGDWGRVAVFESIVPPTVEALPLAYAE